MRAGGPHIEVVAKTYRPYQPEQTLLLPPALEDWLPEGHLARFVSDVVDELDLTAIEATYEDEERGYPPYHPRMMVKVLVYAYCTGVYSSRRIARALTDSVAFRYLGAGNEPDFRTISDFRKRHGNALEGLFVQVLQLCRAAGLVKLGRVAVDGSKVKANASKHKAMSYGRMKQREAELEKEVSALLKEADRADQSEDARYGRDASGDELPGELSRRQSRLEKIRQAKKALEEEAKAAAEADGKKEATPEAKAQRNFTDSESRLQHTTNGYVQGYNAQLAVDDAHQVILAQEVVQTGADVNQLIPVVEKIEANIGELPARILGDAGYWSERNDEYLFLHGIDGYLATGRERHDEVWSPGPRGRIPTGMRPRDRMTRKLQTAAGRAHYRRRKAIVEPVFGLIKQARGFRQFLRRGLAAVRQEWSLICTAHNLLKLYGATA
jgi:transposase